jgi:Cu(I)/Ag(I) efflux system membrane fusion protein
MRLMLVFALALFTLAACKEAPSGNTAVTEKPAAPKEALKPESNMGPKGTEEFMNMLVSYYSLKDALVASDGAKADDAASRVMSAAEIFHSEMPNGPHKDELMKELRDVMAGTEAIMALKADSLEAKRRLFADVSDAVYKMAKLSELKNGGMYQQFCPMALNDKGAYWLSPEEEIKNPYFGKKMMECGEVRDSL